MSVERDIEEWFGSLQRFSWGWRNLIGQDKEWTPRRNPRTVTASDNVNPLDDLILVDSTAGNVTMTLETAVAADGRRHTFKKTVAANSMIVDGNGSETIDGAATVTRTDQHGFVTVESDGTNWRIIAQGNSLFSSFSLIDPNADRILFWDDSAGKLEWLSMGNSVAVTTTTLDTIQDIRTSASPTFVALTLSNGQLVFPATQVPSAGANTLDDYEEGTWTPVVTFATPGDLSVVYSTQAGFYRKIGAFAPLQYQVITSTFTHTTASGDLRITGSPFTSLTTTGSGTRGALSWAGITKANYTDLVSIIGVNSVTMGFPASGSTQAVDNVDAVDVPTGGTVNLIGVHPLFTA